jgi:hypothetical protein
MKRMDPLDIFVVCCEVGLRLSERVGVVERIECSLYILLRADQQRFECADLVC